MCMYPAMLVIRRNNPNFDSRIVALQLLQLLQRPSEVHPKSDNPKRHAALQSEPNRMGAALDLALYLRSHAAF